MRRHTLRTLLIGLALAGAGFSARAEDAVAPRPDAAADQRRALDAARGALKETQERRERFAAEIEALKGERGRLQAALKTTVDSIRDREQRAQERAARLDEFGYSERQLKASLVARRGVLADVIAALQRMGRQPPPALLVRPNDALEAIRSAILLGAVVPDMRAEAEALASDLREMARLKGLIADERDGLTREAAELAAERERLAALVDERQKQLGQRQLDLMAEADKAGALTRDVGDLEGLIGRMEQDQAAHAAAEAAKALRPEPAEPRSDIAALDDTNRLAPAMPFERMHGMLPFPVSGRKLSGFGVGRGGGGGEGVSFSTAPGAPVTAPADGWVVYLGRFRSYGQLLILNVGGGYHVVLAGMERITVGLNQFVLAGEPVAAMAGDPAGAQTASPSVRPVLYVEFRKDRGSIDPSPWWAGTPGEKVGG